MHLNYSGNALIEREARLKDRFNSLLVPCRDANYALEAKIRNLNSGLNVFTWATFQVDRDQFWNPQHAGTEQEWDHPNNVKDNNIVTNAILNFSSLIGQKSDSANNMNELMPGFIAKCLRTGNGSLELC